MCSMSQEIAGESQQPELFGLKLVTLDSLRSVEQIRHSSKPEEATVRRSVLKEYEKFAAIIRDGRRQPGDPRPKPSNLRAFRKAMRAPLDSLEKAFKAAGHNRISEKQLWLVAVLLAHAIYGKKTGGRPKFWNKAALLALRNHIDKLSKLHPEKTELQLCNELIKRNKLKQFKPETLRRKYQIAKSIGKKRAGGTKTSPKSRPEADDGWL
jgi:hypothetical protein